MIQQILHWIEQQHTEMLDLLMTWAAIPSSSDNLAGLGHMIDALEMHFSSLEGKIERVPLSPRTLISPLGIPSKTSIGHALRVVKRPNAPFKILLAGHMDTVYPLDQPQQKISVEGQFLRGPGVADMKGGLVVMLTALKALERFQEFEAVGWEVIINPDEETGSVGSEPLLVQAANRCHLGLVFEPSFADGAIVSSRKGSMNAVVVARGKAAHAGRDFEKGKNAILAIAHFIAQAHRLNNTLKGISINPGSISGGGPVNIVPELAICRLNARSLNPEDFVNLKQDLQQIIDKNDVEGVQLSLHIENARKPKVFDEKSQSLFELLNTCALEEGYTLNCRPSGGVCDGNIIASQGRPVIDTLGVIGGDIHTPNEYMLIDSLVKRTRLVSRLLFKLAKDFSLWKN